MKSKKFRLDFSEICPSCVLRWIAYLQRPYNKAYIYGVQQSAGHAWWRTLLTSYVICNGQGVFIRTCLWTI